MRLISMSVYSHCIAIFVGGLCSGLALAILIQLFFEGAPQESRKHLARLKAEFCGEAIEMPGDPEYRAFAGEMASYDFEPSLELDKDQIRRRGVSHSA